MTSAGAWGKRGERSFRRYRDAHKTEDADFDLDRDVDGVDFLTWQSGYPTAAGASFGSGDTDGDGAVDGVDFLPWQTDYPYTSWFKN